MGVGIDISSAPLWESSITGAELVPIGRGDSQPWVLPLSKVLTLQNYVITSDLVAAASDATLVGRTVLVISMISLDEDLTWPADRQLMIAYGSGGITISAGMTLTFSGLDPILPEGRVFYGNGSVKGLCKASPCSWGATPDTGIDSSVAFQAAFSSGAKYIGVPAGTYTVDTAVQKVYYGGSIYVVGEGLVILDATNMPAPSIVLDIGGVVGTPVALSADAALGDIKITTSLTVAIGDIIRLKSTDPWTNVVDEGCDKGEMVQVRSVSGTEITLVTPLMDSYSAATTTVARFYAPRVELHNIKVLRSSLNMNQDNYGIRVKYSRNVVLSSVWSEWHSYGALSLLECFEVELRNCKAMSHFVLGQGNCYGLAITSCQRVKVLGGNYMGGRHGITHGGAYPCRDITIIAATIDNECHDDDTSNPHSLDSHSGCQNLKVLGCTINNGAWIGAIDLAFDGNVVRCRQSHARRDAVRIQPGRSGARLSIRNNQIRAYGTGVIHYGLYVGNDFSGPMVMERVDISNNSIDTDYGYGIYISCAGAGNDLTFRNMSINDNDVKVNGAGCSALHVQGGTGGSLTIGNLSINGGSYQSANARAMTIYDTATSVGLLRVKNVVGIADTATQMCISISSGSNVTVSDNILSAGATGTVLYLNNPGTVSIKDNSFVRGQNSISTGANVTTVMSSGNQDATTHRCAGLISKNVIGLVQDGRTSDRRHRLSWYSATPTVGTWEQGDVVIDEDAAAGASMGVFCTSSGTFENYTGTTTSGDSSDGTTIGSAIIVGMPSTTGLIVGSFVTVSAGFPTTGPYKVRGVAATTITIDTVATSVAHGVTVATIDPIFKPLPSLGA